MSFKTTFQTTGHNSDMEIKEFIDYLRAQGFPEPVVVKKEGNIYIGPHSHNFEALALIINGEISLDVGGNRVLYKKGDTFHLKNEEVHSEKYGPYGVEYLVSRKVTDEN